MHLSKLWNLVHLAFSNFFSKETEDHTQILIIHNPTVCRDSSITKSPSLTVSDHHLTTFQIRTRCLPHPPQHTRTKIANHHATRPPLFPYFFLKVRRSLNVEMKMVCSSKQKDFKNSRAIIWDASIDNQTSSEKLCSQAALGTRGGKL